MPITSMLLQSLLEAADDKKKAADEDTPDDTAEETSTDTDETEAEGDDNADDNPEGEDNETPEDESEPEDENPDNESEEEPSNEENQDDNPEEPGEDDFSLDSEDEGDEPPPDGLVDPDDDGSGDMEDDDGETNVHTNILQLSNLDRNLAKRKCYNNFLDLRTSITSAKKIVDDHEASIDPELRSYTVEQLDLLYTSVTDYITIKFQTINYEENLQNYLLFVRELNTLVDGLNPNSKNKKSDKKPRKAKKSDED